MGQIIKLPIPASRLGYKRVRTRGKRPEDPSQLQLFPQPTAQVLQFTSGLTPFEHALMLDERGDSCAVELYQKAIADEDCAADAYCNLGIIESKAGRAARALDCFTNALKLNPRHSEAHYNLGNVYFEVNDFRLAQIHYELAAQIDPTFPNVYFNLGLVLSINKELAAAVKALVQYQQMVPREEGEKADELLRTLRKSLLTSASSRTSPP